MERAGDGVRGRRRDGATKQFLRSLFLSPRLSLVVAALSLCLSASARAEDRVTVRPESGIGKVVLLGRIVEWTGGLLRIRSGEDMHDIEAERVVDVQTARLEEHLAGVTAFEAGKPADEVLPLLTTALDKEPRVWMRREILAALVRVELAMGQRTNAARHFLALESSDPGTQFFRVIPLDWGTIPPDASLASAAQIWMRSDSSEAAKLLGASVLLFDPGSGDKAAETLDRLASVTDPRIYTLARAQLWRRQLAKGPVPEGEIDRWEDRVKQIPEPLRGGAYFLIGRARSDAGDPERAAAALLWLPLVYDADPTLAAEAAVLAGDELSKIGRAADAVVLFREAVARFPYTPAAQEARTRLDQLLAEKNRDGEASAEP